MSSYEAKLRHRLMLYRVLIIGLLLMMILIGEMSNRGILLDSRHMTASAQNVTRLILFGGIVLFLILHHKTNRLLRDKAKRGEQRIREYDERRQYIHHLSNTLTLELLFGIGILAILWLSYIDGAAFKTAYSLLLCGLTMKGITYLICKSKVG